MPDPCKLIANLGGLQGELNRALASLRCECEDITEQWELLQGLHGQRADAAAQLLCRLRPALDELAAFAGNCSTQITQMHADPYQRNEETVA